MAAQEGGLTGVQKFFLIAGFLITGSINTVTKKWQFQSCGPTNFSFNTKDAEHCQSGWKNFHKPWTQNIQMFIGESLVIGVFLARRGGRIKQARELNQEYTGVPSYIFLLPTCCDVMGTGVGGVGMLFISASVWQMMRGSLMIFAAIWSMIFLKKKIPAYEWCAVFVSAIGLTLVGTSAILDADPDDNSSSNVPLGILLTVVSQAFAAAQMVVEEIYVKGYKAPPEQVVGSEGLWGIIIMIIVLAVMYFIPGSDAGSYENAIDSMHMLFGSSQLLIFVAFYLVSISFFNFFGVTIAGKLSAVHRTINDAMRTMIIWAVEVLVYYYINKDYGTKLTSHTWLQLCGFALLVLANFIKSAIIKLPCLTYPSPEQPAVENKSTVGSLGSTAGVSLIAERNPQEPNNQTA